MRNLLYKKSALQKICFTKNLLWLTLLLILSSCSTSISDSPTSSDSSFRLSIPLNALASRAVAGDTYTINCKLSGSIELEDSKQVNSSQKAVTFKFSGIPVGKEVIIEIEIYDQTNTLLFVGKESAIPGESGNNVEVKLKRPGDAGVVATFVQDDQAKLVFYDNNRMVMYMYTSNLASYGIPNAEIIYMEGPYSGNLNENGTFIFTLINHSDFIINQDTIMGEISSMSTADAKQRLLTSFTTLVASPDNKDIDCVLTDDTISVDDIGDFTRQQ